VIDVRTRWIVIIVIAAIFTEEQVVLALLLVLILRDVAAGTAAVAGTRQGVLAAATIEQSRGRHGQVLGLCLHGIVFRHEILRDTREFRRR